MPVFDFHVRLAPRPGAKERLLATLDECGIDRAAVAAGGTIDLRRLSRQLVEGGHVETDADNDAVLAAAAASGGRLVPFWFANPYRPAAEYADRGAPFRGLEISPAVHGVPLTDPRVDDLVVVAAGLGQPVYVVCITRPGCEVADLVALARRHPRVRFVLGHSGVGNIDYYGVDLVAPVPNIWFETSGGYSGVLRDAVDTLGAERVLFGSEFPLQHPEVELAKYRAAGISSADRKLIAWENAVHLLETP
jgi:predicted TIM-barrel fold metal-dependent hydrolase